MSSITSSQTGFCRILFYNEQKDRKTLHLGKVSLAVAKKVQNRLDSILTSKLLGAPIAQDDATWLSNDGSFVRKKFECVGLLGPAVQAPKKIFPTVEKYFDDFILRAGKTKKPGTIAVWKQVHHNLIEFLAKGIRMAVSSSELQDKQTNGWGGIRIPFKFPGKKPFPRGLGTKSGTIANGVSFD